jgi:hypothetical protein
MSQQKQITCFISTAKVDKLSTVSTNEDEHVLMIAKKKTKKQSAFNLAKRPHSCYLVHLIILCVLRMTMTGYTSHRKGS